MSLGPLMISLRGTTVDPDEHGWLKSPAIAGVILFSRNYESPEQLEELIREIRSVRSPPLLVTVDQEGGRVQRFGAPFQRLPPMRSLGYLYDTDPSAALRAAEQLAWLMAAELRVCGVDMSFAPVVDIDRGLASVIGDRALHHSGEVVASLAAAFLVGAKSAGMHVCAKHFPTHAGAVVDSHEALATDKRKYEELIDDLVPYRHLISRGLRAVMMAHVVFPDLDSQPASFSSWWINTQLREALQFSGVVISDDISMGGAVGLGTPAERAIAAIDAGCDLVLLCNDPDAVPGVIEALENRSHPASQHRLSRLRGEACPDREKLRSLSSWQDALATIDQLNAAPNIELRG